MKYFVLSVFLLLGSIAFATQDCGRRFSGAPSLPASNSVSETVRGFKSGHAQSVANDPAVIGFLRKHLNIDRFVIGRVEYLKDGMGFQMAGAEVSVWQRWYLDGEFESGQGLDPITFHVETLPQPAADGSRYRVSF